MRRLANSSRSIRKTNSAQPSRLKNTEFAYELSLQLHHGRKEGFTKDIRMYKKFGRHNKDAGSANNDEEQFATQLFIS
jgi:hypothetical protein